MTSFFAFEKIATSLPDVTVEPHFEKISFRIKKKIFATYNEKEQQVVVKLSIALQEEFCSLYSSIYPVQNKWGTQGWTIIELEQTFEDVVKKVTQAAYTEVSGKK